MGGPLKGCTGVLIPIGWGCIILGPKPTEPPLDIPVQLYGIWPAVYVSYLADCWPQAWWTLSQKLSLSGPNCMLCWSAGGCLSILHATNLMNLHAIYSTIFYMQCHIYSNNRWGQNTFKIAIWVTIQHIHVHILGSTHWDRLWLFALKYWPMTIQHGWMSQLQNSTMCFLECLFWSLFFPLKTQWQFKILIQSEAEVSIEGVCTLFELGWCFNHIDGADENHGF